MNLPIEFTAQTQTLLGKEEYEKLVASLEEEPPVSIRLNPWKWHNPGIPATETRLTPVSWCSGGFYLDRRLTFTFDPLFHAGCYYVQEAASMFLEQVMRRYVTDPVVMLDLCAAPGGKSTHALSLLPEGSLLVANEVIRSRSQILTENIIKWGYTNAVVTNNDPADFRKLTGLFDVVLVDAPCSGEGMFRKDSGAIKEWSPANVEICRQRQRRILADIWPALKPGGMLIYSTCTYNTRENEEHVSWLMEEYGAEAMEIDVPEEWNITGNLAGGDFPVYRFLPHRTRGEGFFLAVVRKGDDTLRRYPDVKATLAKNLRVIHSPGANFTVKKGKDSVPSHELAMSKELSAGMYPACELTYSQAIAYLRREAIVLDESAPRGYLLVTYKHTPLGFVKNIGNRANNLYPPDWRIRSGYLPEEIQVF